MKVPAMTSRYFFRELEFNTSLTANFLKEIFKIYYLWLSILTFKTLIKVFKLPNKTNKYYKNITICLIIYL